MFLKKSIVLTSNDKGGMAILKLDNLNPSYTYCTIKSYNLNGNEYILGIKSNDTIIKQNVFFDKNGVYNFKLDKDNVIDYDNINLVLAEENNGKLVATLWNSQNCETNHIINAITPHKAPVQSTSTKKDDITDTFDNSNNIEELFEEDENLDNIIEENIANTVETESYNDNIKELLNNATPIDATEIETPTFYDQIKSQIDELFNTKERESNLEKIVPNSEWVKMDYNTDSNKQYVVGVIYEESKVKYICFGVPGNMDTPPEDDLKDYSQWLPIDIVNPKENGYWVMYQDAVTGDNVILE